PVKLNCLGQGGPALKHLCEVLQGWAAKLTYGYQRLYELVRYRWFRGFEKISRMARNILFELTVLLYVECQYSGPNYDCNLRQGMHIFVHSLSQKVTKARANDSSFELVAGF